MQARSSFSFDDSHILVAYIINNGKPVSKICKINRRRVNIVKLCTYFKISSYTAETKQKSFCSNLYDGKQNRDGVCWTTTSIHTRAHNIPLWYYSSLNWIRRIYKDVFMGSDILYVGTAFTVGRRKLRYTGLLRGPTREEQTLSLLPWYV